MVGTTEVATNGNFRGNYRGIPWDAKVGSRDFATDRAVAHAVDKTVAFTVEVS